jgi:hypothetical protein
MIYEFENINMAMKTYNATKQQLYRKCQNADVEKMKE